MGETGALHTFCDDSYLIAKPDKMAEVMQQVHGIYNKLSLEIGIGPGKTLLIFYKGYDKSSFPYLLDDPGVEAPHVV